MDEDVLIRHTYVNVKGNSYHYNLLMKSFYCSSHFPFIVVNTYFYYLCLHKSENMNKMKEQVKKCLAKNYVLTMTYLCLVQTVHWPCMSLCKHITTFKLSTTSTSAHNKENKNFKKKVRIIIEIRSRFNTYSFTTQ